MKAFLLTVISINTVYTVVWQDNMLKYYYLCLIPLTVPEAGLSKVKAPADSVSGKGLLPGSYTAIFLLCPHMAIGTEFSEVSLLRTLVPSIGALPSGPNHLL